MTNGAIIYTLAALIVGFFYMVGGAKSTSGNFSDREVIIYSALLGAVWPLSLTGSALIHLYAGIMRLFNAIKHRKAG
jgi:hypothetical protein